MQQQEDAHLSVDGSMSVVLQSTHNEVIDKLRNSHRSNVLDLSSSAGQSGALLRTGEFVLYEANQWMESQHDDTLCVGQIIDALRWSDH
jgi:hypothetical protein